MTGSQSSQKKRRRRRGRPVARPGQDIRTSRAVARRTDLFAQHEAEGDITETEIRYVSGTSEGILRVWSDPRARLDGHALALFSVLCEKFLARETVKIAAGDSTYWAIRATPRALALAVYGRADGREYHYLGLSRDERHLGALQALKMTLIQGRSVWLDIDGKRRAVTEGFSLVDYYRWDETTDRLLIVLSPVVQRELVAGGQAIIPGALMRQLGPKHDTAMRLAYHVLSHAPLTDSVRRIGVPALIPVIAPPTSRDPSRYPGRFLGHLRRLLADIDQADTRHHWWWEAGTQSALGNVVCEDR